MVDLLGLLIDCYNKNDFSSLRPYLSENCRYTSQWVFDEMVGGDTICDYLIAKSKHISETGRFVVAKRVSVLNPYPGQEAALMFQGNEETPSCIILIEVESKKISQIDICIAFVTEFQPIAINSFLMNSSKKKPRLALTIQKFVSFLMEGMSKI